MGDIHCKQRIRKNFKIIEYQSFAEFIQKSDLGFDPTLYTKLQLQYFGKKIKQPIAKFNWYLKKPKNRNLGQYYFYQEDCWKKS